MRPALGCLAAAMLASACGGSKSDNPDAGTPPVDAGSPTPPADLLGLPIVTKGSGAVMTSPKLVTITFPGDPLKADFDALAARLGQSAWWKAVASEYGIGPTVPQASVVQSAAAPATITDSQLQTFIISQVGMTWPSPTANTIYLLYFPQSTTIQGTRGFVSCQSYAGYHSTLTLPGSNFPIAYAIIPRCAPDAFALDSVTQTVTHEVLEAATDPFGGGLVGLDDTHSPWDPLAGPGGELGDMCEYLIDQNITPTDLGYSAQRCYSNAQAALGREPCVPVPADEKFAIAKVVFTDPIEWTYHGQAGNTWGVVVPYRQSRTVDVQVTGDDPNTLVTLSAKDLSQKSLLSFSFDRDIVHVGETVHLTISVNADSTLSGDTVFPFDTHALVDGRIRYWFGFIHP